MRSLGQLCSIDGALQRHVEIHLLSFSQNVSNLSPIGLVDLISFLFIGVNLNYITIMPQFLYYRRLCPEFITYTSWSF